MDNKARTTQTLRETLFGTLDDLRKGNISPSEAKAVTAVAAVILKSVDTEISATKHLIEMDSYESLGFHAGPALLGLGVEEVQRIEEVLSDEDLYKKQKDRIQSGRPVE